MIEDVCEFSTNMQHTHRLLNDAHGLIVLSQLMKRNGKYVIDLPHLPKQSNRVTLLALGVFIKN